MLKLYSLVFLIFILLQVNAEHYVRVRINTPEIYMGGVTQPATEEYNEMWISNDHIVMKTTRVKIIYDLNDQKVLFIFDHDSTYVISDFPLDISKLLGPKMLESYQNDSFKGDVIKVEETREVFKKNCNGYQINIENSYLVFEISMWYTKDVPFKTKTMNDLFHNYLKLYNFSDSVLTEMNKYDGLVIYQEQEIYYEGNKITRTAEVIELDELEVDQDFYMIPSDYLQRERIRYQDLY